MKNKNKVSMIPVLWLVLITALFAFSTTACSKSGGGGGKSLNSATALKEYLDKQPVNGPDKPIKVAMKANEMMIKDIARVIGEAGKYVSLDISGSPLTTIPEEAFKNCETLVGIIIPNSITSIEDDAFRGTSLTSVTIPNSVNSIGWQAFRGCTSLTSVTIPNSVTSIEDGAFQGCTSLTSVTISNGVTSIEDDTFRGCSSLTSVTIPNSVTSIGESTFSSCTSLTSITIPNSVTYILESAFAYCSGLTSITIPNSVTSIGVYAFNSCTSLTSVTFQGTITSDDLEIGFNKLWNLVTPFPGDLRDKYLAGGIGTYTRPNGDSGTWTKQ
jgi:hypothetical protein